MSQDHFNLLFLSSRNTARNYLPSFTNRLGRGKFTGFSAGMKPAEAVDPMVLDILRLSKYSAEGLQPEELGGVHTSRRSATRLRISSLRPRSWRATSPLAEGARSPPIGAIQTPSSCAAASHRQGHRLEACRFPVSVVQDTRSDQALKCDPWREANKPEQSPGGIVAMCERWRGTAPRLLPQKSEGSTLMWAWNQASGKRHPMLRRFSLTLNKRTGLSAICRME